MSLSLFRRISIKATVHVGPTWIRYRGVEVGHRLQVIGFPIISRAEGSRIRIGDRAMLISWADTTALGVNHPVVLRTLRKSAEIQIGNDVGISGGTLCAATRITIGAETMLGANVTVVDTDFHPIDPSGRRYCNDPEKIATRPVEIGRNVFVGTGSIILKGVRIGDNAVIGAGSVVSSDIPANAIAAGNPCRVIKYLETSAAAAVSVA